MKNFIKLLLLSIGVLSLPATVLGQSCSCASPGPNLISNGDFETDWVSNVPGMILTHTASCSNGYGTYGIGNSANKCYPGWNACDHTFNDTTTLKSGGNPKGHFLIIDPNTTPGNIYSKTVTVCQNTSYQFTFWAKDLLPVGDARPVPLVNIQFNGVDFFAGNVTIVATTNSSNKSGVGVWQKVTGCWYSGSNTSIAFSIVAKNVSGNGNDLGIDDISFSSCSSVISVAPSNSTVNCSAPCTNITASVSPGLGTYTYSWSPGGQTDAIINVCPSATTTYTVSVSGTENCAPFTKTVLAVVTVTGMSVNVPSATICPADSATLTASGATTYTWSPGTGLSATTGASVVASPITTTTYTVTGITNGCTGTTTAVVTVNSNFWADAGPDVKICPQQGDSAITLTAQGGNKFLWSTGEISQSIIVHPTETTVYSVIVDNGCGTATDMVTISVQCGIEIPNVITPNGDMDNQYFVIKGLEGYPGSRLEIYDRWGLKIYENSNYLNDWDGLNYKNKIPVTDGVYYYILYLADDDKTTHAGFVQVLRGR